MESWRTTYADLLPESYLANLSLKDSESRWRERLQGDKSSIVCASDHAGRVVGFAAAGPGRGEAFGEQGWELYAIYMLQRCQGVGLGRRLFADALETAGGVPALTWCLSANPSRSFYEALGGKPLGTQSVEIGGVKLEETCYGWRDAGELRRRLRTEC